MPISRFLRLLILGLLLILASGAACAGRHASSSGSSSTPEPSDDDAADDDSAVAEPFSPLHRGPYQVGNRSLVFQDDTRWDIEMGACRRLLVEVWYPADDSARNSPPETIRGFLGRWDTVVLDVFRLLGTPADQLANFSRQAAGTVRDAKLRTDRGPYPMVLFSHGNAAIRFSDFTMCDYLASHGYIVVAPDHSQNAVFVAFPDALEIYNPLMELNSYFDREDDLEFLIDRFTELNENDPDGVLTGMIDIAKIGVIGHSFGAVTAQEVITYDDRLSAAVGLAGFQFPILPKGFDKPIMTMFGEEDHTLKDYELLYQINYLQRPAPKLMLDFVNGGHYTFTDACLMVPYLFGESDGCGSHHRYIGGEPFNYISHGLSWSIINAYVAAFFGAYVKGQPSMTQYLQMDLHPEEVIYYRDLER